MTSQTNVPNVKLRRPRYDLIGGGIFFLLVTTYFAYGSISSYFHQLAASRQFVPVSATVVNAEVVSRGSSRTTHGESFRPRIVYRYSVEGKEYENDRYFFTGKGWRDHSSAQYVVANYPAGMATKAYFNPKDPHEAVLDASKPSSRMLLFLMPFLFLSLVIISVGIRGRAET